MNGVQIDYLLHAWVDIVSKLNEKFPCKENGIAIRKVKEALFWQHERTSRRTKQGTEGTNKEVKND